MKIEIKYDGRAVRDALARLERAGQDLTPAMSEIAAALEDAAKQAFADEASPAGEPWADLSEATKAIRAKDRKWPGEILRDSAILFRSITRDHDRTSAVAGTNVVYAALHQFGAERGAFGRTRRGGPIPWGDVPARPFLGRSDRLDNVILDAIARHLGDALR